MVKIDLITGFLGSGKTTFLKKYASYYMQQGKKIGILENDYGAVNVDMMLLQDLEGEQCELEMVAGGCDSDCHKRRFKTKLIAMGMCGYDRVLVEPSGIFDLDEFFDVLREDPLDRWFEIGSILAIVDANLEEELSEASEFLLASQVANAGLVLLSKTTEQDAELERRFATRLENVLMKYQCNRSLEGIIHSKNWDAYTDADFCACENAGYKVEKYVKRFSEEESGYSAVYIMNKQIPLSELEDKIRSLFISEEYGTVFRVKGFMKSNEGYVEINATKKELAVSPINKGQDIIIVIGEHLNQTAIEACFE